jgi:hypothetical protein
LRVCDMSQDRTYILLLSHNFSNDMINITRLNEVHLSLLKNYTQGYSPQQQHLRLFGTPVQTCLQLSNTHRHSGPPNTEK